MKVQELKRLVSRERYAVDATAVAEAIVRRPAARRLFAPAGPGRQEGGGALRLAPSEGPRR
jgi:hypothetical protein